jgi:hypothetical protein
MRLLNAVSTHQKPYNEPVEYELDERDVETIQQVEN